MAASRQAVHKSMDHWPQRRVAHWHDSCRKSRRIHFNCRCRPPHWRGTQGTTAHTATIHARSSSGFDRLTFQRIESQQHRSNTATTFQTKHSTLHDVLAEAQPPSRTQEAKNSGDDCPGNNRHSSNHGRCQTPG